MSDNSTSQASMPVRLSLTQAGWYDWEKDERAKHTKILIKQVIPNVLNNKWKDRSTPPGLKYRYDEIPDVMTFNEESVNRERKWIHLVRCDSIEAVILAKFSNQTAQVAVLNLADEKQAGGLLYAGSCLHEESLCVRTALFDSLNHNSNYPLLDDEVFYSGNVICFDTVPGRELKSGTPTQTFDIVFCAAIRYPEVTNAQGEPAQYVDENEIVRQITVKLENIMRICVAHSRDTVILGAFGCGGFKHPAKLVAQITKSVLTALANDWRARGIKDIIIAVNDRKIGFPVWYEWVKELHSDPNVAVIDQLDAINVIHGLA